MKKITENKYLSIANEVKENEYKDFKNKFEKNRNPYQFARKFLQELSEKFVAFQSQNNTNQIYPRVRNIFDADKNLTFFQAIELYCKEENKSIESITKLLAEYKGMEDAYHAISIENPILIEVEEEKAISSNKEFTTARQVLAMHFIFEYMQIRNNDIDKTDKSKFIEFLTGKNHQNIYALVLNPFVTKAKEFRFDDLKFIRTYFEDLGINEIVRMINDQLDKPR